LNLVTWCEKGWNEGGHQKVSEQIQVAAGEPDRLKTGALNTLHLIFASASYMAPGLSLFFTTAVIAGTVGLHIGAAYIVATIGIACTASALVQFSRKIPSAGSFQTFIGRSLGAKQSYWISMSLIIGYVLLQAGVITAFGYWTQLIVIHYASVSIPWQIFAIVATLTYGFLMIRGVHVSIQYTVMLFLFEFAVIVALGITILGRGAFTGHGISATPLAPAGWSLGAMKPLFVAIVFSAYSFIGFEGAASYAEETSNPKRNIPIGIFSGVILIGVLYIFSSWTIALAFPSGSAIAAAASPYLTAGSQYWGAGVLLIYLAGFTSISANIMAAGNANVRILFNGAREGIFFKQLAHVHKRQRTPDYATVVFLGSCLALSLIASIWWSSLVIYALWSGIGALLAIVAYLASNIGVAVYYFRVWRQEFSWFTHGLLPVIALAVWGYTLYDSLKPGAFPANAYPWGIGGAIVLSVGFLFYKMRTNPKSIERIGDITSETTEPNSPTMSPRK
jgi:amino acid transporter